MRLLVCAASAITMPRGITATETMRFAARLHGERRFLGRRGGGMNGEPAISVRIAQSPDDANEDQRDHEQRHSRCGNAAD